MDRLSRDFESVGGITTCASVSKTTRELKLPAKRGSCLARVINKGQHGKWRRRRTKASVWPKVIMDRERFSTHRGDRNPKCGKFLGFIRRKGSSTEAMLFVNCVEHRWHRHSVSELLLFDLGNGTSHTVVWFFLLMYLFSLFFNTKHLSLCSLLPHFEMCYRCVTCLHCNVAPLLPTSSVQNTICSG